jgi:DNA-binding IclR family transcriptional regulator
MTKDRTAVPSTKLTGARANRSASTTKSATVLDLLRREQGSTLAELVDATAWQPHTARAMLTGLRKKGHAIERRKRGDLTCYHLPSAEA